MAMGVAAANLAPTSPAIFESKETMKIIGKTSAGTIIVEVSVDELLLLSEQQSPPEEAIALTEELANQYEVFLNALLVSQRALNALVRQLGYGQDRQWFALKFNTTVFYVKGRAVLPPVWAKAVLAGDKDDDLLSIHNFGTGLLAELKTAIAKSAATE